MPAIHLHRVAREPPGKLKRLGELCLGESARHGMVAAELTDELFDVAEGGGAVVPVRVKNNHAQNLARVGVLPLASGGDMHAVAVKLGELTPAAHKLDGSLAIEALAGVKAGGEFHRSHPFCSVALAPVALGALRQH